MTRFPIRRDQPHFLATAIGMNGSGESRHFFTRSIKVGRPPRIVLFYMTAAFVPEDGTVQFADDVYGHDARLDAWLQAKGDGGDR